MNYARATRAAGAPSCKFKFNRSLYEWRRTGNVWKLICSGRVVATVEPDHRFSSMFRIKFPDGSISDMVNLARGKDAALSLADAALDGRIRRSQAPRIAFSTEPAGVTSGRQSRRTNDARRSKSDVAPRAESSKAKAALP
jgi:hypothetical protein